MTGELTQRQHPRAPCALPVRLAPADGGPFLRGTTVNLSASGALVASAAAWPVGTRVVCRLEGDRRTPAPGPVGGEIVRLERRGRGFAIAVRFATLAGEDATRVRALVETAAGPRGGRLACARFAGTVASVRAGAVLREQGAEVTVPLPFLRVGSEIDLELLAGPTRVSSRGVVRSVTVDCDHPSGVPVARATVEWAAERSLTPVSGTARGEWGWLASPERRADLGAAPPSRRSRRRVVAGSLAGLVAAWAAAVLLPTSSRAPLPAAPPLTSTRRVEAPSLRPPPPPRAAPHPFVGPPPSAAPVAPDTPGPRVEVSAGETAVLVPFTGETIGAAVGPLPGGVAVRLPSARAGLPPGVHRIRRGPFRSLWVRPDGAGVELRLLLARNPTTPPVIEAAGGVVRVALRR